VGFGNRPPERKGLVRRWTNEILIMHNTVSDGEQSISVAYND
jgi:hypothetical protein